MCTSSWPTHRGIVKCLGLQFVCGTCDILPLPPSEDKPNCFASKNAEAVLKRSLFNYPYVLNKPTPNSGNHPSRRRRVCPVQKAVISPLVCPHRADQNTLPRLHTLSSTLAAFTTPLRSVTLLEGPLTTPPRGAMRLSDKLRASLLSVLVC